jgi:hypothetical protein
MEPETPLSADEWAFLSTLPVQRENLELRRLLLERQEQDLQRAIAARLGVATGHVVLDLQRRVARVASNQAAAKSVEGGRSA